MPSRCSTHHPSNVPTPLQSRRSRRDECPDRAAQPEPHDAPVPTNCPLRARVRRHPAGVGRIGRRAASRESRDVADSPRIRPRQPGLAALDRFPRHPLPVPALRRARVRALRPRVRRHADARHLRGRSRRGGRRRGTRALRAPGHVRRRPDRHRLCGDAPRAREPPRALRHVGARALPARRGSDRTVAAAGRADPRGVGRHRAGLPAGLQLALHPQRR